MTTLARIAKQIKEHAPAALPGSMMFLNDRLCSRVPCREADGSSSYVLQPIPDDIAGHILISAMVMDAEIDRPGTRWESFNPDGKSKTFPDGREPSLLSCYAAWKWARGIA